MSYHLNKVELNLKDGRAQTYPESWQKISENYIKTEKLKKFLNQFQGLFLVLSLKIDIFFTSQIWNQNFLNEYVEFVSFSGFSDFSRWRFNVDFSIAETVNQVLGLLETRSIEVGKAKYRLYQFWYKSGIRKEVSICNIEIITFSKII